MSGLAADTFVPELGGTVGDALLATHRSYLAPILPLLERDLVKGMAHITGGGITENMPRVFPEGCAAAIDRRAWQVPPLFTFIQERGAIAPAEMFRAFNMGVGLVVVCAARDADTVLAQLASAGETGAVAIGSVVAGDRDVRYVA
jgi:phosphoribosylformylglycinamidine cyclo-ligase